LLHSFNHPKVEKIILTLKKLLVKSILQLKKLPVKTSFVIVKKSLPQKSRLCRNKHGARKQSLRPHHQHLRLSARWLNAINARF